MPTSTGSSAPVAGGPDESVHIEFRIDGMVVSVAADKEWERGPATLVRAREAIARLAQAQARASAANAVPARDSRDAKRPVSTFHTWAYRRD